jgi:hypothetical protein
VFSVYLFSSFVVIILPAVSLRKVECWLIEQLLFLLWFFKFPNSQFPILDPQFAFLIVCLGFCIQSIPSPLSFISLLFSQLNYRSHS